jgi:hypothetical protein
MYNINIDHYVYCKKLLKIYIWHVLKKAFLLKPCAYLFVDLKVNWISFYIILYKSTFIKMK